MMWTGGAHLWPCEERRAASLRYSGNFARDGRGEVMQDKPPGSHCGLVLQKIRLLDETSRRE